MKYPAWHELNLGCIVTEPGNAGEMRTGDWRSERPVWDHSKCVKCGMCYIYCPDMAVEVDKEGNFGANLYWCKGCGICAAECWTEAISMVLEEG